MAVSQVRQNFHAESEEKINKQINQELYASYVYLSMVSYPWEQVLNILFTKIQSVQWSRYLISNSFTYLHTFCNQIININLWIEFKLFVKSFLPCGLFKKFLLLWNEENPFCNIFKHSF